MKSLVSPKACIATLVAAVAIVAVVRARGATAEFRDPLDQPAAPSRLAATSPLMAVARAGDRLVAVGHRGHVVTSTDGGASWLQSQVPVSSDLVGVCFPTGEEGWAVGHDGVVLHSSDGGRSWQKQLDGRAAAQIALTHYEKLAKADAGRDKRISQALQDAKRLVQEGADKPFLDVWFENRSVGWVIGAFNSIFHTVDGGKTWVPWLDRTDNPDAMHLRAIRGDAKRVFIVGERGLILRLDRREERFVAGAKPYPGTYFGVLLAAERIVAFGLAGNAYVSGDDGSTWQKLESRVSSPLTGGTVLTDGRLLLVSQGGDVLRGARDSNSLEVLDASLRMPLYAAIQDGQGRVVLLGPRGARTFNILSFN